MHAGRWKSRYKAVGRKKRQIPSSVFLRADVEESNSRRCKSSAAEKTLYGDLLNPYFKPTQVGWLSKLR